MDRLMSKIKWFWSSYVEMKKRAYPLATLGGKLIICSIPSTPIIAIGLSFYLPNGVKIAGADVTSNDLSVVTIILGILTFLLGAYLIFKDLGNLVRHTARVLITGMKGTTDRFPEEILSKAEKKDARETVVLSALEPDVHSLDKQVQMYNSERYVDLYNRFILHDGCSKVYLGGLARVPFLVAYGACFNAVSSKIIYFDKFHKDGNWNLLNDENQNIKFDEYDVRNLKPNQFGDIGIALSFSNEIKNTHIPEWIRDNVVILKPNKSTSKNLIKNQENLQDLAESFKLLVDDLSNKHGCLKLHLFLAVQSTFALELGRQYQEGTHKNWVIHNFNAQNGAYEWALEISRSELKEYSYSK